MDQDLGAGGNQVSLSRTKNSSWARGKWPQLQALQVTCTTGHPGLEMLPAGLCRLKDVPLVLREAAASQPHGLTRNAADSQPPQPPPGSEGQQAPGSHPQQRAAKKDQGLGMVLPLSCCHRQGQACFPTSSGADVQVLTAREQQPPSTACSHPTAPCCSLRGRVALGIAVGHAKEVSQLLLVFWLLQSGSS